jgi:hypothetical protein
MPYPVASCRPQGRTRAASAPSSPSALVAGAGDGHVDGLYLPMGTFNGREYFNLESAEDDPLSSSIYWSGAAWRITLSDGSVGYNNNGENVANPWDSAMWITVDGIAPAPTVTEAVETPVLNENNAQVLNGDNAMVCIWE